MVLQSVASLVKTILRWMKRKVATNSGNAQTFILVDDPNQEHLTC